MGGETSTVEGTGTETPTEAAPVENPTPEDINNFQPAAVSGASGWAAFLNWVETNWPWLLPILTIPALLYWWWIRNQSTSPTT